MIRVLKVKTPLLALVASAIVEAVFVAVFFAFRNFTEFGDLNFISWIFFRFHASVPIISDYIAGLIPGYWGNVVPTYVIDTVTLILVFTVGMFQWYIVFFLTIGVCRFLSRRFSSKPQIGAYFLVALLAAFLLSSVFFNAYICWQIYGTAGWRERVLASVRTEASREASDDFREKHFRLYRLGEAADTARYTGTNDGPFEIWNVAFFPSFGSVEHYSAEKFIECYNEDMSNKCFNAKESQPKAAPQHHVTNSNPN
jgi:hypothetical protein